MSKHTPGPWEFVDAALVGPKIDDKPIWLRPVILRSETGINEANARLIAAAPELLTVLQELQESAAYWSEYDVPLGIVDRINAAIAKATGENV